MGQTDQKTVDLVNIERFRVLAAAIGNTSRALANFDRQDSSQERCLAEIAHQRSWHEFTVLVRDSYPWQEGPEFEARARNASESVKSLERTIQVVEGLYPGTSDGNQQPENKTRSRPRAYFSRQQIAAAIREMRSEYIGKAKAISYFEINNGLCDDFARDVAKALGGETDKLYSVENGDFAVDGDAFAGDWDWDLLETHWGIKPGLGLKKNQAHAIDFGGHVWLTDGTLHYDAECPDGVSSFFDLPIFRRHVVLELRNSGVACDDVLTEDVLPSPVCPVPNPARSIKRQRTRA